jgi:peroxiredoxin
VIDRSRRLLLAVTAGTAASILSIVLVLWIAGALASDGPQTDGSFRLEEPGVFDQPSDEVNPDSTGQRLPSVALLDVDGGEVRIDGYRDGPMVVNVWYSTCPPCARELADFAAVHDEIGDEVRFVGVDPRDTVDAMVRFADERGVDYELLRDQRFAWVGELGVLAYPTTLFVDADGTIVRQTGVLDADQLRAHVAELF